MSVAWLDGGVQMSTKSGSPRPSDESTDRTSGLREPRGARGPAGRIRVGRRHDRDLATGEPAGQMAVERDIAEADDRSAAAF